MKKNGIYGLFPILMLAVVAVCMLTVILSGAKAYSSVSERDGDAFTERTAIAYVRTKINSSLNRESVSVEKFGDTDAITISQFYGNTEYLTRLYCYNGQLYELFSPKALEMSPEDGEKVVALDSVKADISGGLLSAVFTRGGESEILIMDLGKDVEHSSKE